MATRAPEKKPQPGKIQTMLKLKPKKKERKKAVGSDEDDSDEEEEDDERLAGVDVVHISKYRIRRKILREGPAIDLEGGVVKERKLTDPAFIVLFALGICAMCFVAARAWTRGDPYRLLYGTDSFGNTCHRINKPIANVNLSGQNLTENENVFFMGNGIEICIQRCLNRSIETPEELVEYIASTMNNLCLYNVTLDDIVPFYTNQYTDNDTGEILCPELPIYPQKSVFHRCLMDMSNFSFDETGIDNATGSSDCSKQADDIFTTIAVDIQVSVYNLLILCGTAIALSALMLLLIGIQTRYTVWTMVVSPLFICIGGMYYCWYKYTGALEKKFISPTGAHAGTWLALSILITIAMSIILVILFLLAKKINITVPLFKEASRAMGVMPMIRVQPFLILVVLIGVIAIFMWLFLYIQSAVNCTYGPMETAVCRHDPVLFWFKWYYIACFVWIIKFLFGCEKFLITAAVCDWYFTRNKGLLDGPVYRAMQRLVTRHLGSVALGSLVVNSFVIGYRRILKFVIEKIDPKSNGCSLCIHDLCSCCKVVYNKYIKFIHSETYVMTGIYGCPFMEGCHKAFVMSAGVGKSLAQVCFVGNFVILLGEVAIILLQFLLTIYLTEQNEAVCLPLVPIPIGLLATAVISFCFLEVYKASMEALYICFCEDTTRNDGKRKPYFMDPHMREFLKQDDIDRAMQNQDLDLIPIQDIMSRMDRRPQQSPPASPHPVVAQPSGSRPQESDRSHPTTKNLNVTNRFQAIKKPGSSNTRA